MSDLQKYIDKRKKNDQEFSIHFEEGFKRFKTGVMLKQERELAILTQQVLVEKPDTKKSVT